MHKKRERKKVERKRRASGTFLRYVEMDKSLELPAPNSSDAVLTAYIKRVSPLIEGHEDEPGSGLLAWRVGKALIWMKDRFDNGQIDMGDGTKSTFIPKEFRTVDGHVPIIKVGSIEKMEQLAREKMEQHNLISLATRDDDDITCPRVLLIHPVEVESIDDLENVKVVAEIRVDPTGKWD